MRDYAEQTAETPETATTPLRGAAAAQQDMTPVARAGGIWFEIFEGPAKHPVIETAYRATKIGLTAATGIVFLLAVYTMLTD